MEPVCPRCDGPLVPVEWFGEGEQIDRCANCAWQTNFPASAAEAGVAEVRQRPRWACPEDDE